MKSEHQKFCSLFIYIFIGLVITILTLDPILPGCLQAREIPKIGIIYPKTGIYSSLGPKHLDGLMMAIEDHGSLLGMKPKLFIRDNGTKVSLGVSVAKDLILKEDVNVIIGAINTPINNSIATVCDEYKIPFLYPSGGSIFMSGIGKVVRYPQGSIKPNRHPYMVYTWLNSVQRAYACIDVADLYGKKWYFIASDYEHGREGVGFAQKILHERFGDEFVNLGVSWAKQGEVNYTTPITKAISSNPDVVFVLVPGRFVQFQKQAAAMGLTQRAHIHWSYGERISASADVSTITLFTGTGTTTVLLAKSTILNPCWVGVGGTPTFNW